MVIEWRLQTQPLVLEVGIFQVQSTMRKDKGKVVKVAQPQENPLKSSVNSFITTF